MTSDYPPEMWNEQDAAEFSELPSDSVATLQKPFVPALLLQTVARFVGIVLPGDGGSEEDRRELSHGASVGTPMSKIGNFIGDEPPCFGGSAYFATPTGNIRNPNHSYRLRLMM